MSKLLWKPTEEKIMQSNMYRFMNFINETYNQNFNKYAAPFITGRLKTFRIFGRPSGYLPTSSTPNRMIRS